MKLFSSVKNRVCNKNGSALVVVLLVFMVVTIIGMALVGVTANNFKLTSIDRDYQSVYYIAEAGIHNSVHKIDEKVDVLSEEILTHNSFFDNLGIYLQEQLDNTELTDFASQFGKQPFATITVDDGTLVIEEDTSQYSERTVRYILSSIGFIGDRKREVNSSIDVIHRIDKSSGGSHVFNYSLFSPNNPLTLPNSSKIDGSIYSKDIHLTSAGTIIDGNLISETFVKIDGNNSHPEIKGNVCALNGFVEVSGNGGPATVHGDVNASNYVIIGSAGTIKGSLFSGGYVTLKASKAMVQGDLNALGNVTLESGTSVLRHVFTRGNVSLLNSNSRIYGDVHAGGNIYKPNKTYIDGSSWAGGTVNQRNPESISQLVPPRIEPKAPSFCITLPIQSTPELKSFSIGTTDVSLLPNWSNPEVQIISPGTYKNLIVNGDNTVRFVSGDYYFDNIYANNWGIKVQLDLSNGPINVYTKQNVNFGGGGNIQISENGYSFVEMQSLISSNRDLAIKLAGKVYWESHNDFNLGDNRNWFGSVFADNNFTAGSAPRFVGAYAVNRGKITLGNNPEIIYAPPTDSAAGGGTNSGGNGGAGENTIPQDERVKISVPIKEN